MKTRTMLMAGATALASLAAPLALGQEQTVNDYVRSLIVDMTDSNETLVDTIQLEELETYDSTEFIFEIDPDKSYFVYGACDDDCTDIDLEAHDADEDIVDTDEGDDDAPMLLILPGESGDELHVVISLSDCDTDTCVVGVGVYEAD